MDNELNEAFTLVSQHDNVKIKQGEAKLDHLRKNNYYPLALLIYINNNQNLEPQLRAAIQLKIWCQSYYKLDQYDRKFYQEVIEEVKNKIVMAYLVFQGKVSQTLRPAIVKLTGAEFPTNWNGLMPGLILYTQQNPNSIHSVLLLISDITLKYSYLGRSDPLYEQINIVCDQVHDYILDLTVKIIQTSNLDEKTLNILQTLLTVFYHLNYQDLHPNFEENLDNWMGILKKVMNFANSSQSVFKCKGAALESILLYASKYKQDVSESIKGFSSEIWDLCSNATEDPEYDTIVFNSLKYFKSIIMWQEMKSFFADNLDSLIQKLIMPNIKFNKAVLEMFYDEPENFFEYYFKNGEIGSRRAASLDLLRVICRNFPNFQGYVVHKIQQFTANMANASIQQKCTLLNFIIDGASKAFRDIDGCTQTYINSDYIVQFYQHIVKVDLAEIYNWILNNENKNIEDELNMTLLITLMRYCFYFRIYLPMQNYQLIIQFLAAINTKSKSVNTLIFITMNAFLTIKHGDYMHFKDFTYYFNAQNTQTVATQILKTIYKNDQSFTELNQNLTKMLYTLSKLLGHSCLQFYDYFDVLFKQMLLKTNQYDFKSVLFLFQSIGNVAFWAAKNDQSAKQRLQTQIMDYFQVAITRNSDLLNFCFQILAIFLQFENKNVTQHQKIYDSILNLNNWTEQNMSIMSSYIQYISAYLIRSPTNLISDKPKFEVILSRLVELEHFDLFFRFLLSILKITNIDQFYQSGYFQLSIHGAQTIIQKSLIGRKQAVLFIFKLMNNFDLNKIITYLNNVSANLFENLITSSNDLIRSMQIKNDRKQMYGALCKIIAMGILKPEVQGSLLSLLIDNSTNRFNQILTGLKDNFEARSIREKKESTYQKLQIFKQIDVKQNALELDEQEELCKIYQLCQSNKRPSLQIVNEKNHDRMKRMIDKHTPKAPSQFPNNQNKIF